MDLALLDSMRFIRSKRVDISGVFIHLIKNMMNRYDLINDIKRRS